MDTTVSGTDDLTTNMGDNRDAIGVPSNAANAPLPSSSTDVFNEVLVVKDAAIDRDDAISSTTTEQTTLTVKLPILSPVSETEAFFNSELSMASAPTEKITEDVEDIVQDLENLLESGDSYIASDSGNNSNSAGIPLESLEECLNGQPSSDEMLAVNSKGGDGNSLIVDDKNGDGGSVDVLSLGSEALSITSIQNTENEDVEDGATAENGDSLVDNVGSSAILATETTSGYSKTTKEKAVNPDMAQDSVVPRDIEMTHSEESLYEDHTQTVVDKIDETLEVSSLPEVEVFKAVVKAQQESTSEEVEKVDAKDELPESQQLEPQIAVVVSQQEAAVEEVIREDEQQREATTVDLTSQQEEPIKEIELPENGRESTVEQQLEVEVAEIANQQEATPEVKQQDTPMELEPKTTPTIAVQEESSIMEVAAIQPEPKEEVVQDIVLPVESDKTVKADTPEIEEKENVEPPPAVQSEPIEVVDDEKTSDQAVIQEEEDAKSEVVEEMKTEEAERAKVVDEVGDTKTSLVEEVAEAASQQEATPEVELVASQQQPETEILEAGSQPELEVVNAVVVEAQQELTSEEVEKVDTKDELPESRQLEPELPVAVSQQEPTVEEVNPEDQDEQQLEASVDLASQQELIKEAELPAPRQQVELEVIEAASQQEVTPEVEEMKTEEAEKAKVVDEVGDTKTSLVEEVAETASQQEATPEIELEASQQQPEPETVETTSQPEVEMVNAEVEAQQELPSEEVEKVDTKDELPDTKLKIAVVASQQEPTVKEVIPKNEPQLAAKIVDPASQPEPIREIEVLATRQESMVEQQFEVEATETTSQQEATPEVRQQHIPMDIEAETTPSITVQDEPNIIEACAVESEPKQVVQDVVLAVESDKTVKDDDTPGIEEKENVEPPPTVQSEPIEMVEKTSDKIVIQEDQDAKNEKVEETKSEEAERANEVDEVEETKMLLVKEVAEDVHVSKEEVPNDTAHVVPLSEVTTDEEKQTQVTAQESKADSLPVTQVEQPTAHLKALSEQVQVSKPQLPNTDSKVTAGTVAIETFVDAKEIEAAVAGIEDGVQADAISEFVAEAHEESVQNIVDEIHIQEVERNETEDLINAARAAELQQNCRTQIDVNMTGSEECSFQEAEVEEADDNGADLDNKLLLAAREDEIRRKNSGRSVLKTDKPVEQEKVLHKLEEPTPPISKKLEEHAEPQKAKEKIEEAKLEVVVPEQVPVVKEGKKTVIEEEAPIVPTSEPLKVDVEEEGEFYQEVIEKKRPRSKGSKTPESFIEAEVQESRTPLKMTIAKNKTDNVHSILKICEAQDREPSVPKLIIKQSSDSEHTVHTVTTAGDEPPIPKITIKAVPSPSGDMQHSPKITIKPVKPPSDVAEKPQSPKMTSKLITSSSESPRIIIKSVSKPESAMSPIKLTIRPSQVQQSSPKLSKEGSGGEVVHHSPKITIKPVVKPPEESQFLPEETQGRRITIKPVVKPVEESGSNRMVNDEENDQPQMQTRRVNIKPIVRPAESSLSPKISFKPVVKPPDEQSEPVDYEEEIKQERIVLKIKGGKKEKSSPVEKITLKLSKEGDSAKIVPPYPKRSKRGMKEEGGQSYKKTKMDTTPARSSNRRIEVIDLVDDTTSLRSTPPIRQEEEDPLAIIPPYEITAETLAASLTPPAIVTSSPTTTPKKRGRPRKIQPAQHPVTSLPPVVISPVNVSPAVISPVPVQEPVYESSRPKRSCRSASVTETLGIKRRKTKPKTKDPPVVTPVDVPLVPESSMEMGDVQEESQLQLSADESAGWRGKKPKRKPGRRGGRKGKSGKRVRWR